MADILVLFDLVHHGQTIHYGHHYIGDNEVGHHGLCEFQSLLAIRSLQHLITTLENTHQEGTQVVIVFYNEQFILGISNGLLFLHGRHVLWHIIVVDIHVFRLAVVQHLVHQLQHLLGIALHHL